VIQIDRRARGLADHFEEILAIARHIAGTTTAGALA
jgi:hypothetical protein